MDPRNPTDMTSSPIFGKSARGMATELETSMSYMKLYDVKTAGTAYIPVATTQPETISVKPKKSGKKKNKKEKYTEEEREERKALKALARAARRRAAEKSKWKQLDKRERESIKREKRDAKFAEIFSQGLFDFTLNHKVDVGSDTQQIVDTLADRVTESFREISGNAAATADTIKDTLHGSIQQIMDGISSFMDVVKNVFWLVPVIATICIAACRPKWAMFASAIVGILSLFLPSSMSPIIKLVEDFVRSNKTSIESQSGLITNDAMKKLVVASTVFMLSGPKRYDQMLKMVQSKISFLNCETGKNIGFATNVIMTMEDTVNTVLTYFGKDKVRIFECATKSVDMWCNKVSVVTKEFSLCQDEISAEMVGTLQNLRTEGQELENMYRMDKAVAPVLQNYLRQLDNVCMANSSAFSAAKNCRVEPVCLGLYGNPGTGKTILCNVLTNMVMAQYFPAERSEACDYEFADQIFQQGTSEYWNGYCGQFTHVMDDYGQQVNAVGALNTDYMNLIRAVNTWMYPLNFADLANKGKNNYRSRFVMLSTNVANMRQSSAGVISDADAVIRRIHFPYQLGVSREFRAPGKGPFDTCALDANKYAKYMEEFGDIPTHAWFFAKYDFSQGKRIDGHDLQFDELVDIIVQDLKTREQRFFGMKKQIKNSVRRAVKQKVELESQAGEICMSDLLEPTCVSEEISTYESSMAYMRDNLAALKDQMKKAVWDPRAFARENPFITALICAGSLGIFFYAAKHALSSLCEFIFKEKDPVLEEQAINLKLLKEISEKKDLPIDVQNSVIKNMFHVTFVDEMKGIKNSFGNMVGISDSLFMIPSHFITQLESAKDHFSPMAKVYMRNCHNETFDLEVSLTEFLLYPRIDSIEEDTTFMKMPVAVACKDIVDKFIEEKDLYTLRKFDVILAGAASIEHSVGKDRHFGLASRFDRFRISDDDRIVNRGYKYNIATSKGDCGSLLMLGPKTLHTAGRKIIGMHTAGQPAAGLGFSNIVTREMVDNAIAHFGTIRDKGLPFEVVNQCDDFCIGGSFMPLYTVAKKSVMPPYTKLAETPLYEAWCENTRFPAHLRSFKDENGDVIFPMIKALSKYNGPVRVYSQEDIEDVAYFAWDQVTEATKDIDDRIVYTYEEAVAGDPTNPLMRGIPRRTSAGYPFCTNGAKGKKDFFGYAEEYDFSTEENAWLKQYVEEIIESAKRNERMFHVFNDFLKDERRSEKKNKKGETRLVSGAPLAYVIAFRMYFARFTTALMECRVESGCAAGINVYQEWEYLKNHLMNKSEHVIAGDYSAFDSSEQPQIHDAILDYINKWYDDGEENARIRRVLWRDLTNSRHIGGDGRDNATIYQWNHSLPSGHPATTAVNSMYNLFLFAFCWKKIMGDANMADYQKCVRAVVLGDDNLVAIRPEVVEKFNQHTITDAMTDLFMTYTTEAKDDEEVEATRKISEVTFLKREFRDFEGHCYGPLSMETITQMPYWCRDKHRVEEIMCSNVETALMELSAHPKEVWDEWAPRIVKEFARIGYKTAVRPVQRNYQAQFRAAKVEY